MPRSLRYDRHLVGWLSLAQLISWGSIFYLFALLISPVEQALGMSRVESSLAFSLAMLAEGFMAYPVGRWIDRGHERVVMTVGSAGLGVCLLLLSVANSAIQYHLVWLAMGAAMAATLYSPAFAVVTRRFPNDFRRAIITLTFLGGLASTVFIPLISWLITQLGWRHALWPLAALHLLVCMPLHAGLLKNAPAKPVAIHQPHMHSAAQPPHQPAASISTHLRSASFLLIGVFMVLMMAVQTALPAHMVNLLRENGLGEAWAIAIPASIGAIQVLGRLLLYFFEHHFDLHLANRLIPSLISVSLIVLLIAPWAGAAQAYLLIGFVFLYGLGNGMSTIVKGTAIAEYVNREHVASLNGALGIPMALARAAAPFALGLLWSPQIGYTHGLWLLLAMSVVSITALVMAQNKSRRVSTD